MENSSAVTEDFLKQLSIGRRVKFKGKERVIVHIASDSSYAVFKAVIGGEELRIPLDTFQQNCLREKLIFSESRTPDVLSSVFFLTAAEEMDAHWRKVFVEAFNSLPAGTPVTERIATYKALTQQLNRERCAKGFKSKTCPHLSTVYSWNAIFKKSGVEGLRFKDQRKLSRKPRIDEETRRMCLKASEDFWLIKNNPKLVEVRRLLTKRLNDKGLVENLPSDKTIKKIISQSQDFTKVKAIHSGNQKASQYTSTSRKISYSEEIGARVEIDSKYCKVYVKSSCGLFTHLVRLLAIIDVATRCIIGYDLSDLEISAQKTSNGLSMAVNPMSPYSVIPAKLYADNGAEFVNGLAVEWAKEVVGAFVYCRPGDPNGKPHIERWLRTADEQFFSLQPGYLADGDDVGTRYGNYNKAKASACLTVKELRERFEGYLEEYHGRQPDPYRLAPAKKWDALIKQQGYLPATFNEEELLKLRYKNVGNVSLSGKRVNYKGVAWYTQTASHLRAYGSHTDLYIDDQDLEFAYLKNPSTGEFIRLDPVNPASQSKLSLELHLYFQKQARETFKQSRIESDITVGGRLEQLIVDKSTANSGKSQRKKARLSRHAEKKQKSNTLKYDKRKVDDNSFKPRSNR